MNFPSALPLMASRTPQYRLMAILYYSLSPLALSWIRSLNLVPYSSLPCSLPLVILVFLALPLMCTYSPASPPKVATMLSSLRSLLLVAQIGLSLQKPVLLQQYVKPASTLPPTPVLPEATVSGYVNLTTVDIFQYQFGRPLDKTLADGCSPILFLHGGFANSNYWANQIRALLEVGIPTTIIAMDSRLQGRSTGADQPISYDLMREDVIGVLDHFQIPKVTVIGWSDGGILGYELAIYHPKRLDRLFDFAGSFNPSNGNTTLNGDNPPKTFTDYFARAEDEFKALSPTPSQFQVVENKILDMFAALPQLTEKDFGNIPTLYQDCEKNPFIYVVDASDEEVVNRTTPLTLHTWIPASGLLLLPSVGHFA